MTTGTQNPNPMAAPRENRIVSELPPPPPPSAFGSPSPGGSPLGDVDWDKAKVLARQWYQPLFERESWMAAAYLFVGVFSAIGFFVALNVVGWLAFGLMFIGVGVFLVRPFFLMVERLCSAERGMAGWVGIDIPARPVAPMSGLGLRAITDVERWRQVGFLAINLMLGTAIGSAGTGVFGVVPRLVVDGPYGSNWSTFAFGPLIWLVGAVFGLALLGAAPRIAKILARFKAHITSWFLGPDQLAAAQARVSTLSTQRQDILDAVASERRRIERNLHDGVQQQLVAIGLDLGMAEQQIERDPERAKELIVNARQKVQGSIGELRQLGRGLHPAILEDRGLDAALSAVVSASHIPISVHVDPELELSTDVAETVYFVANEAIANVLKHAKARVASVHVVKNAANVRITVHDDGVGGVDVTKGTGVAGIRARVHAVDGLLTISSPSGGPTTLVAEIPRHDGGRHG